MKMYEGPGGRVEMGLLAGLHVTHANGRKQRVPKWLKHRVAEAHYALKARGIDSHKDGPAKTALWEYVLHTMTFSGNAYAQTEADTPVSELIDDILYAVRESE
jgi:hypothetical protein